MADLDVAGDQGRVRRHRRVRGHRPGAGRLLGGQVVMQLRTTLRNPMAVFFTLGFPLMFLVLFNALISANRSGTPGVSFAQVFSPGIAAFGIIAACFTNLAISVVTARDAGILKRVRGTPLPPWVWLAGRMTAALLVALLSVTIMMTVAALLFDVEIIWQALPAALVTVLVGGVTFCALGFAATAMIPNAEAAPAILNLMVFPLLFVSGIFFPIDNAPTWLSALVRVFPVHHLAAALQADFDPTLVGSGFLWTDLAALVGWTVLGVVLALRFFRWESGADRDTTTRGRPGRRRASRSRALARS